MYKFLLCSLFVSVHFSHCNDHKVFPSESRQPTQNKRQSFFALFGALNCCKPTPVLVEKEPTGWGYTKRLTHKGSLPKGWRRASSHDTEKDIHN